MSRRRRAVKRKITPDPRFGSIELSRFINKVMLGGKRTTAQRIVYHALDRIEDEAHAPASRYFSTRLETQCRRSRSSLVA